MGYIFLIIAFLSIYFLAKNAKENPPIVQQQEIDFNTPATCPYCEFTFKERPRRNRKCPNCQSKIMLRNHQLLTESQAIEYDKAKFEEQRKQYIIALRNNLLNYEELGDVKYVKILASCDGETCSVCKKLNGKRVLLKDELKNPTLPVKDCESGLCRCCYT